MISRETFDLLIYAIIGFGLIASAIRLYHDLTRPLDDVQDDLYEEEQDDAGY